MMPLPNIIRSSDQMAHTLLLINPSLMVGRGSRVCLPLLCFISLDGYDDEFLPAAGLLCVGMDRQFVGSFSLTASAYCGEISSFLGLKSIVTLAQRHQSEFLVGANLGLISVNGMPIGRFPNAAATYCRQVMAGLRLNRAVTIGVEMDFELFPTADFFGISMDG